jgi:hypothetical protein
LPIFELAEDVNGIVRPQHQEPDRGRPRQEKHQPKPAQKQQDRLQTPVPILTLL